MKQEGKCNDYNKGKAKRILVYRVTQAQLKFKGKTKNLKGHVFDVGVTNQAQLFANTTKEIAEYTGRTTKESQDIQNGIET